MRFAATPTTRTPRGLRAGGHDALAASCSAPGGTTSGRLSASPRSTATCSARSRPTCSGPPPPPTPCCPCSRPKPACAHRCSAGVDSHRARFERDGAGRDSHPARLGSAWRGGFWLPECAHAPWIEPALADAGVHATCIELTDAFGLGSARASAAARRRVRPALVPIDRATIALVWSDGGYPAHGRLPRLPPPHHPPPQPVGQPRRRLRPRARARPRPRARRRLRLPHARAPAIASAAVFPAAGSPCARSTPSCSATGGTRASPGSHASCEECAAQGLELVRLDDALERFEPTPATGLWRDPQHATTWGEQRDLCTWSAPAVADIAFATRAAELAAVRAGPDLGPAALRQLLALQSSDWAFMISRGLAVPYARQRFEEHRHGFYDALAQGADASVESLRNLANPSVMSSAHRAS